MEIEMKCIMGELDHPNHNGRIYDSKMMKKAIEDFNKNGVKTCELNPDYSTNGELLSKSQFLSHNLEKTAGAIEDVNIKDGKVFGRIQLLDNENGKTVKELINNGSSIKMGPRMLAESIPVLDENGNQKLDENGNPINEIKDVVIVSMDIVKDI